jgi:TRAP-type C4-dicarboxylate transport system permease small subunit
VSDAHDHGDIAAEQEIRPAGGLRKVEEAVGAAVMAVICVISFTNVVVRYATDISFAFTEEYSVFLLVIMTFVGSSLAFATDRHIRITFFTERLGRRGRRLAETVSLLATTAVFALIVYYGAHFAYSQWELEETSPGLGNPTWIYTIWLPILATLILFRTGQCAFRLWRARR